MKRVPVAEELRQDHFHLTLHLTIPHPNGDAVPTWVATTARHVNGHLVATGPLWAVADLDAPWPLMGQSLDRYVFGALNGLQDRLLHDSDLLVWGTGGKILKENLTPQPVPPTEPLW